MFFNKKISILLLLTFWIVCNNTFGQQTSENPKSQQPSKQTWQQRKAQFKSDRVAFITTKMNLSVEDAQKFWPVYNKYDVLFDQVYDARHQRNDKIRHSDSLSENECNELLNFILENDQSEINLKKKYLEELTSMFSAKFVVKYFNIENDFRRQIINKSRYSGSFGKSFKQ